MALRRPAAVEDRLKEEAKGALTELGDGDTKVLDAEIESTTDRFDNPIWRATLVLPSPGGESWDVHKTFELKLLARRALDDIAEAHGLEGGGTTSVVLTTRTAPEGDVALLDEPESGETTEVESGA